MLQRSCCAVAPPQCSMKEPLPALLTTLVYDGMDAACTASTESTSLLHHHAWHTVRGAEKLRRTNECSRTGRGPCASQPPMQQWHAGGSWPCHSHGFGRGSRRDGAASLHPRPSILTSVPRMGSPSDWCYGSLAARGTSTTRSQVRVRTGRSSCRPNATSGAVLNVIPLSRFSFSAIVKRTRTLVPCLSVS